MMVLFEMIQTGGLSGIVITLIGASALAIVTERVQKLYFSYSLNANALHQKVKSLVFDSKVEEAIVTCANIKKPLARSYKLILERSDRDDNAIYQAQEIALAENSSIFGRRLSHLAMLANVATLVGLLGTVHGLILSFSAVSNADPAQKQTLLAEGISVAMNTTALGLTVAIPTMIAYAILNSRNIQMQEQQYEFSTRLVEILTTGHFQRLQKETLFPENVDKQPKNTDEPPLAVLKSA